MGRDPASWSLPHVWSPPPTPANELRRLDALAACAIIDTPKDERFDRLTRLAMQYYGADAAFIGVIDADYQWIKSATSDAIPISVRRHESVCGLIVSSGTSLVVGDLHADPRLDGHPLARDFPLRFYAGVPLVVEEGLTIGSFCVLRAEPAPAALFDIGPLRDFAALAVDAIELDRINRNLAHLAQIDALTGLANRRSFDSALERGVRRARRTGGPLSVIIVDLDRFKALNDTLGHPAGDAALRRVGDALAGIVSRKLDAICRYGGEEFALVLPDTDEAGALMIAETVQRAVAQAGLVHPLGGTLTASLGVATAWGRVAEPERLIAEADRALYDAKRAGRDRVMASRPSPAPLAVNG